MGMAKQVFFIFLLLSFRLQAQDIPFERDRFPGRERAFSAAKGSLDQGDALFLNIPPLYKRALPYFEQARAFNPENADLNFKLGLCYLNSNYKYRSLEYFKKAYSLRQSVNPAIHYYLGQGFQINAAWDEAIEQYNSHLATLDVRSEADQTNDTRKRIEECKTGKSLTATPVNVIVESLGPEINTADPEYNPHISADESLLIFTSRRKDTYGGESDSYDDQYFEDIYISEKVNGKWSKARNIGPPVNTKSHDAAAGISADGHTLFVFKGDRNAGDLMVSELLRGRWTKPEDVGKKVNSGFHESSACLSSDGNTLYFVSDIPGGSGGRDIYKSRWNNGKLEWEKPQNLGPVINSVYDEEGVFIHPDGKTLYFSSRGHQTMGGYDIFVSHWESGAWSAPQNLGYPVNTPDDDVFFEVSASGLHGYYASYKKEGLGEKDIYMVTFHTPGIPAGKLTIVRGVISDANTHEPLSARIELIDIEKNEHIGVFNTDSKTGRYLVSLPSGRNYAAVVYADGYLFESGNFNLPDTASYKEFDMNLELKPMTEGNIIILNNIFFDTDKFELKSESGNELQRITGMMEKYPTLQIEISGHTDNKGSDAYNHRLSEQRAKSVVDYLISKGVAENRLSYKGYGKDQPFTTNDTPEGRKMNRRIEFKILSR